MGEGGFSLWLELGDGSTPGRHGEILGVAAAGAAVPLNTWPDDPEPLARTMRQAIDDAGLAASDVSVVYASANASGVLDETEASAITHVFGDSAPVVTSIKGAIGESGASGSAACAAAFLCGAMKEAPPIAGLCEPSAMAGRLRLARQRTATGGQVALINSFASGGALFSVVVRVA
jgi:3-oxoacyl-[acyl-carrier-protein] synthase II